MFISVRSDPAIFPIISLAECSCPGILRFEWFRIVLESFDETIVVVVVVVVVSLSRTWFC
jgi:hypothetical protein